MADPLHVTSKVGGTCNNPFNKPLDQTTTVVGGLVAYIAWKYVQRRRFLRSLRIARITPEQLKSELDSGADFVIVDLRHAMDHSRI
jgi:hypothetical protein